MVVLQKCPKLGKGGWAFVDLHQIIIGHGHPWESVTWKKLSLVMTEGNQVSQQLRANGSWYFQPLGTGTSALERNPGWRASVSIIRRQGLLPLVLGSKCLCPYLYTQSIHYSLNIWTSWEKFCFLMGSWPTPLQYMKPCLYSHTRTHTVI